MPRSPKRHWIWTQLHLSKCILVLFGMCFVLPVSAATKLSHWTSESDPLIRALSIERIEYLSVEQKTVLWGDDLLFVREALQKRLFEQRDIEGLQQGWQFSLSDQERCRLALRLFELGEQEKVISYASAPVAEGPSWPVFAKDGLEGEWTCALAAEVVLGVDAPLNTLLQRGDFPLSLPFVQDVDRFASIEVIKRIHAEIEWVEEGLRAPLWTVIALRDEQYRDDFAAQLETWSVGECLDAVEILWDLGSDHTSYGQQSFRKQAIKRGLARTQKHSSVCKEWSRFAIMGITPTSVGRLRVYFANPAVDKDDLIAAFRVLEGHQTLSHRQQKRIRRWVQPMIAKDMEYVMLVSMLRTIDLWADETIVVWLDDLENRTTDRFLLFEIESAKVRIEKVNPLR